MKGFSQSASDQLTAPNEPQPMAAAAPVLRRSAVVSAVPEGAVPVAESDTTATVLAVTGARPAITANLALPSGHTFLMVTCALASVVATY